MPTKSLESLGKFSSFSFMVCGVLDNLPGIRADHMNGKPGWQDWGLAELMQSLEEWKAIHPIKVNESVHRISPSLLPSCILTLHICHILLVFLTKVVSTRKIMDQSTHMFTVIVWLVDPENVTAWHLQQNADKFYKANACVLSAVECNIVYLSAVATYLAHTVKKRHYPLPISHLRLFDNSWMPNNKQWWSGLNCNPIRRENVSSIVLVKVNGLIRRALLDTLATASHASGYISDWLNVALSYSLICWIQTVVQVQVSDTKGNYTITLRENWVDHAELLCMENLNYREIIRKYHHLKGQI